MDTGLDNFKGILRHYLIVARDAKKAAGWLTESDTEINGALDSLELAIRELAREEAEKVLAERGTRAIAHAEEMERQLVRAEARIATELMLEKSRAASE